MDVAKDVHEGRALIMELLSFLLLSFLHDTTMDQNYEENH